MNTHQGFASDNNSGIHPDILKAISEANTGYYVAYGDDPHTESVKLKFSKSCLNIVAHNINKSIGK